MKKYLKSLLVSTVVLSTGCSVAYSYTQTTSNAAQPRAADCSFDLFTTSPDRPYDEVGVLDRSGTLVCNDAKTFKEAVAHQVCAAGGDAVLASISMGMYTQGTVIKYRSKG